MPHLLLIDRSGKIACINIGFNSEHTPSKLVERFNEQLGVAPPG